jgi:hypothetical protein
VSVDETRVRVVVVVGVVVVIRTHTTKNKEQKKTPRCCDTIVKCNKKICFVTSAK